MAYETLIYRKNSGTGRITINRPESMNAITPGMLAELKTAVLDAGMDNYVRVIVLTGAGKAFCAGVDLKSLGDRRLERGKVGDTHAKWALRPTWGMSARLPRRVGFLKAKELSFTADAVSAREAERIGLVNMAVPAEKLEESLQTMTKKIMANSQQSIAAYKHLYNTNEGMQLDKSLELEFGSEFEITDTEERVAQFRK